ncbi:class I SAM-dependent methyltransferase [Candidatus Saccharibacteria bacterium]|nr:class I SAM-dependent methyltransferase [Candidatus Saccharibacteria bacterium]
MKNTEQHFYDEAKNWDFSDIKRTDESLTDWDMAAIINKLAKKSFRILDLGTGGGEKVLNCFPNVKEILGTDFSEAMIETARQNLKKSGRENISFRTMDNLNMDTQDEYFDMVVARHTCIDPVQIYRTLKPGGFLIVRGVDMMDCFEIKRLFGRGQAFRDKIPISHIDYEAILDAGFKDVELVPIHTREYYHAPEDLFALLNRVPILEDFSETDPEEDFLHHEIEPDLFEKYVAEHTTPKGILLIRRYYGITARKP